MPSSRRPPCTRCCVDAPQVGDGMGFAQFSGRAGLLKYSDEAENDMLASVLHYKKAESLGDGVLVKCNERQSANQRYWCRGCPDRSECSV